MGRLGAGLQAIAQTGLHFSEPEYYSADWREAKQDNHGNNGRNNESRRRRNRDSPLSLSRVTREQIEFCFAARKNANAPCRFDWPGIFSVYLRIGLGLVMAICISKGGSQTR
jgi:hypothetical protein